jgi:multidrug resistance efflux pump
MARRTIYRAKPLEGLSSPERLDALVTVTSPRLWLILAGSLILAIILVGWGVLGKVPVIINGEGILLSRNGLLQVTATESGRISEILVQPGSRIKAGQELMILTGGSWETEQKSLETEIAVLQDQLKQVGRSDKKVMLEEAVSSARIRLATLLADIPARCRILSPKDGRVIQIATSPGSRVTPEKTLLTLAQEDGPIEAILFIPFSEGKLIRAGMKARVQPAGVSSSEVGFLSGVVDYTADYPSSPETIQSLLQNSNMVARFMEGREPPLLVRIQFMEDPGAPGSFKWSMRGSSARIKSGTLCAAEIIIRETRPVSLVFRFLDANRKQGGV